MRYGPKRFFFIIVFMGIFHYKHGFANCPCNCQPAEKKPTLAISPVEENGILESQQKELEGIINSIDNFYENKDEGGKEENTYKGIFQKTYENLIKNKGNLRDNAERLDLANKIMIIKYLLVLIKRTHDNYLSYFQEGENEKEGKVEEGKEEEIKVEEEKKEKQEYDSEKFEKNFRDFYIMIDELIGYSLNSYVINEINKKEQLKNRNFSQEGYIEKCLTQNPDHLEAYFVNTPLEIRDKAILLFNDMFKDLILRNIKKKFNKEIDIEKGGRRKSSLCLQNKLNLEIALERPLNRRNSFDHKRELEKGNTLEEGDIVIEGEPITGINGKNINMNNIGFMLFPVKDKKIARG